MTLRQGSELREDCGYQMLLALFLPRRSYYQLTQRRDSEARQGMTMGTFFFRNWQWEYPLF